MAMVDGRMPGLSAVMILPFSSIAQKKMGTKGTSHRAKWPSGHSISSCAVVPSAIF